VVETGEEQDEPSLPPLAAAGNFDPNFAARQPGALQQQSVGLVLAEEEEEEQENCEHWGRGACCAFVRSPFFAHISP